jgi:hypothetical protein
MANTVHLKWDGIKDLSEALRGLPAELRDEAFPIVEDAVDRAKEEIAAKYPVGPTKMVKGRRREGGNLRAGLAIDRGATGPSNFGAVLVLKNTAKHAWLFENGTELRETALGWKRGRMPAGKVFIPIVIRARARMWKALADFVRSKGFTVRGI